MSKGLQNEKKLFYEKNHFFKQPLGRIGVNQYLIDHLAWAEVHTIGDAMKMADSKLIRLIGICGLSDLKFALISFGHKKPETTTR